MKLLSSTHNSDTKCVDMSLTTSSYPIRARQLAIQHGSDTIYLETASDPTGWGLSPIRWAPFWCVYQSQVVTCHLCFWQIRGSHNSLRFSPQHSGEHLLIRLRVGAQSCPTLCSAMNCSPQGSSVHEIFQARRLKRVAMPSSRESSQPRVRALSCVSCISRRVLYHLTPPGKPTYYITG